MPVDERRMSSGSFIGGSGGGGSHVEQQTVLAAQQQQQQQSSQFQFGGNAASFAYFQQQTQQNQQQAFEGLASVTTANSPIVITSTNSTPVLAPLPSLNPARRTRATSHLIVETKNGDFFILSSLVWRADTQLITIDSRTGALLYSGLRGVDLFVNEEEALSFLTTKLRHVIKNKTRVPALLGFVAVESSAFIVVATKTKQYATLFGGHSIETVVGAEWIKVKLTYPYATNQDHIKNIKLMKEFPIEGLHFYCDTFDVTSPFPSAHSVHDYHEDFCWNDSLASSFEKIGLRRWCVVLLQGMSFSRMFQIGPHKLHLCVITRKNRTNPGTRYRARGLNDQGAPGNECECELIMWTGTETHVDWMSFTWRRGTVPLWWKTEIKSQVREPDILIREKPYEGTEKYFRKLLERYGPHPVYIVNMLRCDPKQKETVLSEHYLNALKHVKKQLSLTSGMVNFDWHQRLKQLGPDETVKSLWSMIKPNVQRLGLSSGEINLTEMPLNVDDQTAAEMACPNGYFAAIHYHTRQTGILRYNCADSLDRTNIATFFVTFQIVAEMCRRFKIGLRQNDLEESGTKEWYFFDYTLDRLTRTLKRSLLESLAEFFVLNGDVISMLYTNSPAMHSSLMRDYSPNVASAPINAVVALQRRYQNVIHDRSRQAQYEMILGLKKEKYFPGLAMDRVRLISHYPAWCIKNLPSVLPNIKPDVLLSEDGFFCWTLPQDFEVSQMYIFLPAPCYITEFALTIAHGVDDESYPEMVDVFMGNYFDNTHVLFQGLRVPRCANGTKLFYSVPSSTEKSFDECGFYDFQGTDPNLSSLTRVFHLVFHRRSKEPMTIGKIELFGVQPEPEESPQKSTIGFRQQQALRKVCSIVQAFSAKESSMKRSMTGLDSGNNSQNLSGSGGGSGSGSGNDSSSWYRQSPRRQSSSAETRKSFREAIGAVHKTDPFETTMIIEDYRGDSPNSSVEENSPRLSSLSPQNMSPSTSSSSSSSSPRGHITGGPYLGGLPTAVSESSLSVTTAHSHIQHSSQKPGTRSMSMIPLPNNSSSHSSSSLSSVGGRSHSPPQRRFSLNTFNHPSLSTSTGGDSSGSFPSLTSSSSSSPSLGDIGVSNVKDYAAGSSIEDMDEGAKSEYFRNLIQSKLQKNPSLTFLDTLELEYARLHHNIAPQQRNAILLSMNLSIESFNPSRFVFPRDEKTEISFRKSAKYKSWTCSNKHCASSLGFLRQQQCCYCYQRFCSNCMGPPTKIVEFQWEKLQVVCKNCSLILIKQEGLIEKIKLLSEKQKLAQRDTKETQKMLSSIQKTLSYADRHFFNEEEESLAEYPNAGILLSVPTQQTSLPVESILFPPDLLGSDSHWSGPVMTSSIEIIVVLSFYSLVSRIVLLVDSLGYNSFDAPTITMTTGERVPLVTDIGTWKIPDSVEPRESLEYTLEQPVYCRCISFKFNLPPYSVISSNRGGTSSPSSSSSSSSHRVHIKPFLHIGRLRVLGHPSPVIPLPPVPGSQQYKAYEATLKTGTAVQRPPIKLLWSNYRSGKKVLDMCIETTAVAGFSVTVRHGEEGVMSQIKLLRVLGVSADEKGVLVSMKQIGRYIIPRTKVNTQLYFNLSPPIPVNIVTFEFLANYGGQETCPPKITLYAEPGKSGSSSSSSSSGSSSSSSSSGSQIAKNVTK